MLFFPSLSFTEYARSSIRFRCSCCNGSRLLKKFSAPPLLGKLKTISYCVLIQPDHYNEVTQFETPSRKER
jgi:hypothetical protein